MFNPCQPDGHPNVTRGTLLSCSPRSSASVDWINVIYSIPNVTKRRERGKAERREIVDSVGAQRFSELLFSSHACRKYLQASSQEQLLRNRARRPNDRHYKCEKTTQKAILSSRDLTTKWGITIDEISASSMNRGACSELMHTSRFHKHGALSMELTL